METKTRTEQVEVLLVEDNPQDVELTLRALKKRNLANRVFVVNDGAEALDFLFASGAYTKRNGAPRLKVVLLDVKLPKVNGLEVLRILRADARTHTLPVVLMTSSREQQDIIRSYDLGVNSYVVKPIDFEAFVAAVAELGMYWLLINEPPLQ